MKFRYKKPLTILIITTLLILGMGIYSKLSSQETKKNIKIFLLQSYGIDNSTGVMQLNGAKESLSKLRSHGYNIILREYYMNTKKKNITPAVIREVAKSVYDIIKTFNPDYIITFDDNAFRYVALEYLLSFNADKHWRVVFTGLNKPYIEYKDEFRFDESRVGGVEELVQLKKIHRWFELVGFIPNRYYIFRDDSPSSYFLSQNIEFELKKYGHKNYEILHISTISELRKQIRILNDKSTGMIFAMQTAIIDPSNGEILTIRHIQKEIRKYNTTHVEVTVNEWAVRDVGFAASVGFDFWEMGNTAAEIVVDSVLSEKFQNRIVLASSTLTVNTERMKQLGMTRYYKDALNMFDKIYTSIEE